MVSREVASYIDLNRRKLQTFQMVSTAIPLFWTTGTKKQAYKELDVKGLKEGVGIGIVVPHPCLCLNLMG